jgi:hypothetical protein
MQLSEEVFGSWGFYAQNDCFKTTKTKLKIARSGEPSNEKKRFKRRSHPVRLAL